MMIMMMQGWNEQEGVHSNTVVVVVVVVVVVFTVTLRRLVSLLSHAISTNPGSGFDPVLDLTDKRC